MNTQNEMTAMKVVLNIKASMEKGEGYDAQLRWIENNTTMQDMGVEMLLSEIEQAKLFKDLTVAIDMVAQEIK